MIIRGWQAIFLLALAGLALALLWPRSPDVAELQMRAGSFDAAIHVLERQLTVRPDDEKLRGDLGRAYERAGRLDPALRLIEETARRRPLAADERARGRRLALAEGSPRRALALATATGPTPPGADELPGLVDLALQAGDLGAARRWQARLVALEPGNRRAIVRLRDLALAGSDLRDAIAAQRALVGAGGGPAAARRLADLLLQAGDAHGAYLAVLRTPAPADAAGRRARETQLAQLATWAGRPALALPHLRAAWSLGADRALGLRLVQALGARPSAADADLALAVRAAYPQDAVIRRAVREVQIAAGRTDAVLAELRAAVRAAPRNAGAHEELLAFATWKRHPDVAEAELARWAAQLGDGPAGFDARARLARMAGWDGRPDAAKALWIALLKDAGGRIPPRVERDWRETLFVLSPVIDDLTPAGRENLERLSALAPKRLDVRRRAAIAAYELGEPGAAIAAQQAVLALGDADREDGLLLARWLDWYGRPADSFALLARLDAERPLDAETLRETAYRAAELERWDTAADFYTRAAARAPRDRAGWVQVARAQELRGDLQAAAAAWKRRLALGEVTPHLRLKAVALLVRLKRDREALAVTRAAGDGADPQLLRERATLALRLGDEAEQARALRALIAQAPRDADALVALANLREAAGDAPEATGLYERALAAAPQDPQVVAQVAARRFYGGRDAADLIARLERLGPPDDDAWRLLAEYWSDRDPQRGIAALDALHARGGGTPETWLRRGDLAAAAGDRAGARACWERALALADAEPLAAGAPGFERARVRATALEQLGRNLQAEAAWLEAAAAMPTRWEPPVAIARLRLAAHDPAGARAQLDVAARLAPRAFDVRAAEADWLAATGRHREAADAYAALRRERPDLGFLAAAEGRARAAYGAYGAGRDVVRLALGLDAGNPELQDLYRGLKDDGSSHARPFAELERSPLVNLTGGGTDAAWRLGDAWRASVDLATRRWDDGGATAAGTWRANELGLAARYRRPGVEAFVRGAVMRQDDGPAEPIGQVTAAYEHQALRLAAAAAHQRWAESAQAIGRRGRETRAEAELRFQPDPRVAVRAIGEAGRLALDGAGVGQALGATGELALKPDGDSPWSAYWTFRDRLWGDAGPGVGLPSEVRFHTFLLGYATRLGALRLELQPGWAFDLLGGAHAPTAAASLGLELGPDVEVELAGNVSGQAFDVGAGGSYSRLDARVSWHF